MTGLVRLGSAVISFVANPWSLSPWTCSLSGLRRYRGSSICIVSQWQQNAGPLQLLPCTLVLQYCRWCTGGKRQLVSTSVGVSSEMRSSKVYAPWSFDSRVLPMHSLSSHGQVSKTHPPSVSPRVQSNLEKVFRGCELSW